VTTFVPVDEVYVPRGFDANDSAEIVIAGWLPDLCHKSPRASITVNGDTVRVKMRSLLNQGENLICADMVVPFTKNISLGVLPSGKYKILVNKGTRYEKVSEITIQKENSFEKDDFVYANVEYVEKHPEKKEIVLKGHNPSDCYKLKNIKFISNTKNTYSVLPIMEKIREFCPLKMQPFSYKAELPENIIDERVLLHVRAMDGNSINTIFATDDKIFNTDQ
tara:strand:+ start:20229 stop:20891 length:663 start_codon:yes stop_codon:yes gene_type:complete